MKTRLVTLILLGVMTISAQAETFEQNTAIIQGLKAKLQAAEKVNNNYEKVITLYRLGFTYYNMQDGIPGRDYLNKAVSLMETKNVPLNAYSRAGIYASAGQANLLLGNVPLAQIYHRKALALNTANPQVKAFTRMINQVDQSPDYTAHLDKKIRHWNDKTGELKIFLSQGTSQNVESVKQAFQKWQDALEGRILFTFVDSQNNADVRVFWLNNAIKSESEDLAGQFKFEVDNTDLLFKADINLCLHDPEGNPMAKEHVYTMALHEIGHMLGLPHSPNPADVMYSNGATMAPSARDKATLKALYSMKPVYTNEPGMSLAEYRKYYGLE